MASEKDSTGGTTFSKREAAQVMAEVGGVRSSDDPVPDLWSGELAGERRDATCSAEVKSSEGRGDGSPGLPAPENVGKLQITLYRKAKSKLEYRFWSLYGEVQRADVLETAWRRVKANAGVAGVDGVSIEELAADAQLETAWLKALQEELHRKTYRPAPVRRVEIPKASGGVEKVGDSHGQRPGGADGSVSGVDADLRGGFPSAFVRLSARQGSPPGSGGDS
jgi:RNA-directed DNA polymerase